MITSRPPTAVVTDLGGREPLHRVGHDARVHDLAFDDGIIDQGGKRDLGQNRLAGSMGNDGQLDQSAADIKTD